MARSVTMSIATRTVVRRGRLIRQIAAAAMATSSTQ